MAPARSFRGEPPRDCPLCPRLLAFREVQRWACPLWFNAPVPSFGPRSAELLIVGLAPGLAGANRTGRPFTGDYAGGLLYETLARFGFAHGDYGARADDGLELCRARITNAVRCAPPKNRPLAAEIRNCRGFLEAEIAGMQGLRAILALGTVAHRSVLLALALSPASQPFGHGRFHELPRGLVLADSYHCSRTNTNTGKLTRAMFEEVFANLSRRLGL
jgi:uracil-DNA glycosylase